MYMSSRVMYGTDGSMSWMLYSNAVSVSSKVKRNARRSANCPVRDSVQGFKVTFKVSFKVATSGAAGSPR